jgi:hypothetical protein
MIINCLQPNSSSSGLVAFSLNLSRKNHACQLLILLTPAGFIMGQATIIEAPEKAKSTYMFK